MLNENNDNCRLCTCNTSLIVDVDTLSFPTITTIDEEEARFC